MAERTQNSVCHGSRNGTIPFFGWRAPALRFGKTNPISMNSSGSQRAFSLRRFQVVLAPSPRGKTNPTCAGAKRAALWQNEPNLWGEGPKGSLCGKTNPTSGGGPKGPLCGKTNPSGIFASFLKRRIASIGQRLLDRRFQVRIDFEILLDQDFHLGHVSQNPA